MTIDDYNSAVEKHADSVYRFILKNCRNEAIAQDVVQESFEKLWVKLDTVAGEKAKSYIFTTAYHTLVDILRKEKRMTNFDQTNEGLHFHTDQYNDLSEVLEQALKTIPEIQRTVILLRDYEGYSYDEIAEITGLSESQVKVYIYRGRLNLKSFLVKMDHVI
jgi:RNA polymerase sigma factor (sigma-70 family)